MHMFRFWSADIRGSQKPVAVCQPMKDCVKPHPPQTLTVSPLAVPSPPPSAKRRRSSAGPPDGLPTSPVVKRLKLDQQDGSLGRPSANAAGAALTGGVAMPAKSSRSPVHPNLDRVREVVSNELGHEILLKHNELRLIEQELAKCQVALEQLRRCHLIPYPTSCPTPRQVLDIMSGTGPALQTNAGTPVPRWAPPFGVVDGPYARHYAKWLIPDPMFDGIQVDFHVESRQRGVEGRHTRNSYSEGLGLPAKRPGRGVGAHKLQALSSGYPVKSDKAGPCTLVRQLDGVRVKLVCLDCHRENFSSTQGFINHCRIAHKRDYKSHEEAARKCGEPIAPEPSSSSVQGEDKIVPAPTAVTPATPAAATSAPGFVHTFARPNISEQEAYLSLQKRIAECVKLFEDGRHPFSRTIPAAPSPGAGFTPSSSAPHLSSLLSSRNVLKNLDQAVQDAKQKVDLDDEMMVDDSEDGGDLTTPTAEQAPGVLRVPACANAPSTAFAATTRPASSKGHGHLPFGATHPPTGASAVAEDNDDVHMRDDDELEADLSPNTMSSNNAPSLVSDDGEYEDSEVPSDSEAGDSIAGNSVSEVAEINLEEDGDGRPIRHHRSVSGPGSDPVRLKRDDVKHVTFVSPIKGNSKAMKNAPAGRVRRN